MFETLRKMILPIIIIVLVFFLGMIVLQWGLDLSGRGQYAQANIAGEINGHEISWNQFQQVYNNLYQSEAKRYNYDVPENRVQQLEQQAWDQIVANELILEEADRENVKVSDDDLFMYLAYNPPQYLQQAETFQTDGKFDYAKYQSFMADPQYSSFWASLEPQVRNDLKKIKVQQLLVESALVSEEEVKQSFMESKEKVKVAALRVPFINYEKELPEITEDQKQAYFKAHRDDYKVKQRVRVELVKISKSPSALDTARAERQANEIYDSAMAGADFAELAQTWSADPGSASNGGDLGWFAPGRMVKAFDSAAFAMSEGEISKPIKTQFGFHIIKHQGYRTENDQKQAHVSHILIEINASPETLDAGYQQLDQFMTLTQDKDFDQAAQELGMDIETPSPVTESQRIPDIGQAPEAVRWAFRSEPGDISGVMESPTYMFVIHLMEKLPAGLAEYEEVATRVESDVRNDRLQKMCMDTANAVYAKFESGEKLSKLAKDHSLPLDTLGPFARNSQVGSIMSDPRAIGTAFGLKEQGQTSKPVEYLRGSVILQLIDRTEPDLAQFNETRDSVYQDLLGKKQQQLYSNWYSMRMEQSDIVSNVGIRQRPM